jgi:membrane associated rhomboid family serine protease
LNALVLFETRRPWTVVRAFTIALVINLASGYALSHLVGGFYAVVGLLMGAAYFAVVSTAAVRDSLRNPDYAYAVA